MKFCTVWSHLCKTKKEVAHESLQKDLQDINSADLQW